MTLVSKFTGPVGENLMSEWEEKETVSIKIVRESYCKGEK